PGQRAPRPAAPGRRRRRPAGRRFPPARRPWRRRASPPGVDVDRHPARSRGLRPDLRAGRFGHSPPGRPGDLGRGEPVPLPRPAQLERRPRRRPAILRLPPDHGVHRLRLDLLMRTLSKILPLALGLSALFTAVAWTDEPVVGKLVDRQPVVEATPPGTEISP